MERLVMRKINLFTRFTNLILNIRSIFLYIIFLFLLFNGFSFTQNDLKDLDPHLWDMMKNGKNPKDIEKFYNHESQITNHESRSMEIIFSSKNIRKDNMIYNQLILKLIIF